MRGGDEFRHPVIVDQDVLGRLESISDLAPLHNQANLEGIRIAQHHFPDAVQIAVFDTAFHHDLPDHARYYALPLELQHEQKIRRYGFHGLSHHYVAQAAGLWLKRPVEQLRMISLHLGNGASACAIDSGRSIDISMGFTPLEGLVMGSRCGDLDPALPAYIRNRLVYSDRELNDLLHRRSGLFGLCGDRDMRHIEQRMQEGDAAARLAFDLYTYRIRKYIGAYIAALSGLDVLIFTGGVGENSDTVREAVCADMDALGISIDAERNTCAIKEITDIGKPGSAVRVLVVATNEELEIARAAQDCLTGTAATKMSSNPV